MAKYNLELQNDDFDEISLNSQGDKIYVSGDDAALWDRFVKGLEEIQKMKDELPEDAGEGEISGASTFSSDRIEFCKKGVSVIDGIFGEGTARKAFRDYYESIPGFLPDEWKFIAFFEVMIPIMEDIFNRKIERSEKEAKKHMAKYQPQDHKKPQRKGAK